MLYYEHPINLLEQFPVRFWISLDLTSFLVETDRETSAEVTIQWVWGSSCFFMRYPLDQQTVRSYDQRFVWGASEVKYSPLIRKNFMLD